MNVRPGLLLVLGVTGCVSRLAASPILANGSYHEFLFGPVGSFAGACNGSCTPTTNPVGEEDSDSPWTFTGAATIRLVDLFGPGDRFQLFDNGVSLGVSSSIPASSPNS